jgi:uncharacterized membrane protein YphA (DoxX/SURF4 family)
MRRWLRHPWLSLAARLVLGGVFLWAALPKLADPPAFAKALWAYQLFPEWSLHPLALTLPWLELLCGLALCLGFWLRAAALWLGALLLSFILALAINLARRHPVDCGCFGASAPRTDAQRLTDMRWLILRDLALLFVAAQLFVATPKPSEPGGKAHSENTE